MIFSTKELHLLIVEDNPGDFVLIEEYLNEKIEQTTIRHVTTFAAAKKQLLTDNNFDVILLDLSLSDANGEKLVKEIVQLAERPPVIVLTGFNNKEFGIKTLSLGISDYLLKDELDAAQLFKSIAYSIERKRISIRLKEAEEKNKKHDLEITKAIINTQEEERYQIGRELHDNVNQILATAQLSLRLTNGAAMSPPDVWIDKSQNYIGQAIHEIRKLSHLLAPATFDENLLKDAFEGLVNSMNDNSKCKAKLRFDNFDDKKVRSDIKLNLYRILQEQLKNILKYSDATLIEISLMVRDRKIIMITSDNGKGFDTKIVKGGIGISNMKKRAELFSGSFELNSSIGKGCEIIVNIPVPF